MEPIIGEKIPTAVPDRVFDKGHDYHVRAARLYGCHHVAPSHSNSMIMVLFPDYKALQCTDVCESRSMALQRLPRLLL